MRIISDNVAAINSVAYIIANCEITRNHSARKLETDGRTVLTFPRSPPLQAESGRLGCEGEGVCQDMTLIATFGGNVWEGLKGLLFSKMITSLEANIFFSLIPRRER